MPSDEMNWDFINDEKKSDSAILESNPESAAPEESETPQNEPEDQASAKSEDESPAPSDSPLAWMDGPQLVQNVDSGTRFTSALESTPEDTPSFGSSSVLSEDESKSLLDSKPAQEEPSSPPAAENDSSEPDPPAPVVKDDSEANESAPNEKSSAVADQEKESPDEKTVAKAKPARKSSSSKKKKDNSQLVTILISYASAVTLVCAYLIYQSFAGKPHDLESLPDLKPPMKDDEVAYRLVPEGANLAPGHTLRIGQSKRYGNLRVTPFKVEKSNLEFAHYRDTSKKREPVENVLKLWIRFENVSSDQTFAPLDRKLVLKRIVDPDQPGLLRSNQHLSSPANKGDLSETVLLYDLEEFGDWNFAGVADEPVLKPGESVETYLPSPADWDEKIDGPCVWRVQFRKGYHPESKRGVTTLIEVKFDTDDAESA